jgi:hypothetical protein
LSEAFVLTKKGNKVDFIDFDENTYYIDDIADSLSKQWRWNGAIDRFYSVAEHCYHVSCFVPDRYALDALMHDAAEGYICDVPRPVKWVVPGYTELENKLMFSIAKQFGFDFNAAHKGPVKIADNLLLVTEDAQLRKEASHDWWANLEGNPQPLDFELPCWETPVAKMFFLERFKFLTEKRNAA